MGPHGAENGREAFAGMPDTEVLERARQALRSCRELEHGTPQWARAAARYRRLADELSWRSIDYALAHLGVQPGDPGEPLG